jgi:hypothetical protein
MNTNTLRAAFWLHTAVAGVAGLALYLFPAVAGPLWPWPLPALAARFVGSLLIAAAVASSLSAISRDELPVSGALLMGLTLYGLIALTGVMALGDLGATSGLLVLIAVFGGVSLLTGAGLAVRAGAPLNRAGARPQSRLLRGLFRLEILLVAPVGLLMYLAPAVAQRFWPWDLPPINVRLIGSIFVATMIGSFWGLRQRTWEEIRPIVAAGGTFTTLALIASLLHFNLFNPARLVTWAFIALYVLVALGAWLVLAQYGFGRRPRTSVK